MKKSGILISEEECHHTVERQKYYAIIPILPEIRSVKTFTSALEGEFSSADNVMSHEDIVELLHRYRLMVEDNLILDGEFLR